MCDGTYGNDFSGIETYLAEDEVAELREKAGRLPTRLALGDIAAQPGEFRPCTKSRRLHLAESVCEAVERGDWQETMAAMKAWKEGW